MSEVSMHHVLLSLLVKDDAENNVINLEAVEQILDLMLEMHVELDSNPLLRGPGYLNNLIGETRNHLSNMEFCKQGVTKARMKLERERSNLELQYELKRNELLTMDVEVTAKSSQKDREATADYKLREYKKRLLQIERDLLDLTHLETCIKSKRDELGGVIRDIKTQREIIKDQIKLGLAYGDNLGEDKEEDPMYEDFVQQMAAATQRKQAKVVIQEKIQSEIEPVFDDTDFDFLADF